LRKLIKKYISPFFGTDTGSLNVPYFWSTLFLTLTAICIISIIAFERTDLIGLVAIMAGLVIGLITVYNIGKAKQPRYTVEQSLARKYDANQEGPK